jgi:adenylate cyclase
VKSSLLTNLRHNLWDWRGVAIAAPLITGTVLLLRFGGLLQSLEWATYDQYMRLRPAELPDRRIAIVGINDGDLKSIGQAIIPDRVYANLITKLKAHKPRAIGLDIYRDLPVEPGHSELVQVFNTTPNLVGIQKVAGDRRSETVAPPPALKAKGQVGANDIVLDADNTMRRGVIQIQDANNERVLGFGFYLAALYLNAQGIQPEFVPESETWKFGSALFPPFRGNDGGYVHADDAGYQLLINYRGPLRTFETVSLSDVMADKLPANWGRDRIVMIGFISESSKDVFPTPYSSDWLRLPQRMPGVEIHANITSHLLSATLDGRNQINTWAEPVEWLWILLWAGVGASFTWQMRQEGKFTSKRIAATILAGALLLSSTFGLFWAGWWVPVVPPIIALVGSSVAIMGYVAHSAGRIRKTFGRYLTDEIVANLLENPKGLSLGGERREITILTSDLRSFTSTAERLPPEEVISIINFYLSHMADVITRYQGTIDEFMGDGILVLFGAPTQRLDDAQRAVACAIAMQLEMETVNKTLHDWGYPPLEMGIGVNTGEVIVGNIGSEKRTKYGVMGNQVNLTYRIESYTTAGQILITESTRQQVGDILRIDGQQTVKPKGVQQPITIYDVGGVRGPYNLSLARTADVFAPLLQPIPLTYTEIDGKHVNAANYRGALTHLSATGALLQANLPSEVPLSTLLPPLTNLKLNLDSSTPDLQADIYAKVMASAPDTLKPANTAVMIRFTGKPPAIAAYLDQHYQANLNQSGGGV